MFLVAAVAYAAFPREGTHPLLWQQCWREIVPFTLVRVCFESLFGTTAKVWLFERGLAWLAIAGGAGVLLGSIVLARAAWPSWSSATRRWVVSAGYVAVATNAAALLLRGPLDASQEWGHRYVWLARAGLVTVAVLSLAGRVRSRTAGVLFAAVFAILVLGNRGFYRVPRPPPEFTAFLARLAAAEARLGERRTIADLCERGEWPIRLQPR